MIKRFSRLAVGALFAAAGASTLIAAGGAGAAPPSITMHPKFAVLHSASGSKVQPDTAIPTWNFHYNYLGTRYQDTFVGTNPKTGTSTTVPVDVIPVKMVSGSTTEDPNAPIGGGNSAVQQTLASPLFNKSIDYVQGGTNIGKTQYEDAFQRAALWGKVKTHTGYHVKFGTPTVKPEITITVPSSEGGVYTYDGITIILANINWFDPQIESAITADGIPSSTLPIFVSVNSFLSENSGSSGCCIGGYHSYTGVLAYSWTNYLTKAGGFSQDVSALSHELGEYIDDPYTNNTDVPASCGTQGNDSLIYEVGDPIEVDANFGDYAYTVGGFTWHLQDLVTPVYFGAPASTSVNGWTSLQGTPVFSVCQNGG